LNAEKPITTSTQNSTEKQQPQSPKGLFKQYRSILAIPLFILIIGLCYAYGRLIEVNWIKIECVDIPIRGLPAEFEGFKIVQLSDLYVTELGKREKKLPAMVNSIGADAIFITGDFARTAAGEKIAASIISKLEARHGIWGVSGNWDSTQTLKACEDAGLQMLMSETDTIEIGEKHLGIIGLRVGVATRVVNTETQRKAIAKLKAELPAGAPIILLEHMPRIIHAAQEEGIDLVLSGHTHGGQVRIPFGPAIVTPSDLGIRTSKGLYEFKDTYLYINPGIGLEPGPDFIRVRFWCRPEITVITLRPAK